MNTTVRQPNSAMLYVHPRTGVRVWASNRAMRNHMWGLVTVMGYDVIVTEIR